MPPRPEALRESLERIIAHAKGKGLTFYDLWNEPDHGGFWQGNTKDYLEFMRVAHEAIKHVQPEATVLSGGIASLHPSRASSRNPDMARRFFSEGHVSYDALSLHEHGPFDNLADGLDVRLAEYRGKNSGDKPLWFTETGHNGNGRKKAVVLVQKFVYVRMHAAKGLVWFAMYSPGQGGAYNIIDKIGDPQPVVPAYNQMARMMRGKRFAQAFDIMGRPLKVERSGNRYFFPSAASRVICWFAAVRKWEMMRR